MLRGLHCRLLQPPPSLCILSARPPTRPPARPLAQVWVRAHDSLDEAGFLQELPHALRTEVLLGMASRVLPLLPGFAALGPGALRAVAARLVPLALPPGELLCEAGSPAPAAWVLHEGEVTITDDEENAEPAFDPALLAGYALLGAAAGGGGANGATTAVCHRATITTASVCRLWQLSAADLEAALRSRPAELRAVRRGLDLRRQGPAGVVRRGRGLAKAGAAHHSSLEGGPGADAVVAAESELGGQPLSLVAASGTTSDSVAVWVDARSRPASRQAEAGP